MGCCSTKPGVLKGDEAEQPVRLPSSRGNKSIVDEAQNNVQPDFNNANVDVKGKDVLHQTNKRRSLSNLFKEEEMQMLAKANNTKPEIHASTESEIIRKKMQRQSSKGNRAIGHPAEPSNHRNQEIELIDEPDHVLVAPREVEAKSAPAKPTEQIHKSDPVRDVAPKTSTDTGKLEKANVTTNQKLRP